MYFKFQTINNKEQLWSIMYYFKPLDPRLHWTILEETIARVRAVGLGVA